MRLTWFLWCEALDGRAVSGARPRSFFRGEIPLTRWHGHPRCAAQSQPCREAVSPSGDRRAWRRGSYPPYEFVLVTGMGAPLGVAICVRHVEGRGECAEKGQVQVESDE